MMSIRYDQRIICDNFQIHIFKHAVEIQEKLNRQSFLFHPVVLNLFDDIYIVQSRYNDPSPSDSFFYPCTVSHGKK